MVGRAPRRVVVTGLGAISPVGLGVEQTWRSLVAGISGGGPITLFDARDYPVRIAAEVKGFDPVAQFGRRKARHLDRAVQLALVATAEAVEGSKLDLSADPERVGVAYGTGIGGIGSFEEGLRTLAARGPGWVSPYTLPMMIPNMAAGQIAIEWGVRGYSTCTVTACSASAQAIGEGFDMIRLGRADAMICGGSEAAITTVGLAGFSAMKALSVRNSDPGQASRPFDAERDGFVMGEGAATVVLEEREMALGRGAPILAELVGFGVTSDAHHVTSPHPEGDGAWRAMRAALSDAGMEPGDIDYINAHGTSTVPNDRVETAATRRVFGATVPPMSSTKSMTGHTLGAAGALESVVCIQAIRSGVIPPTINYGRPDPDCDLDYVANTARHRPVAVAMTNSFGFGGHNATLIFRRADT
jgi:3-oxoacyl-[acyl-carrier-protein] synthase II